MGAGTKRKSTKTPPKPPGSKKRRRNPKTTKAQYATLAVEFILTGVETAACIAAGFSPLSAHYLFGQAHVQELIRELRPEVEKRVTEKAIGQGVKQFEITAEFLDAHAAHIIANGATHFMRGDSDRVKAIEVAYKRLGLIEPQKIINNNQANALAAGGNGATFYEVYKSRWLIEKEERMRQQLEKEHGTPRLSAPTT